MLRAVQRGEFPPPRQLDPTIDPALEAVCLKAMATRPEDRYSSPQALAEDIERWMADEPVSAFREPIATRRSVGAPPSHRGGRRLGGGTSGAASASGRSRRSRPGRTES